MSRRARTFFKTAPVAALLSITPVLAQAAGPGNDTYLTQVQADGAVELRHRASAATAIFKPDFWILYRPDDPKLHARKIDDLEYTSAAWRDERGEPVVDYFRTANAVLLKASRAAVVENKVSWVFESTPDFTLEANLQLPPGDEIPVLQFHFQARRAGWYSVGYAGAPIVDSHDVDAIWQPLIWQEKRFPYASFLSPEFACTLPATFVCRAGSIYSVIADPKETPFRFTTLENSRFGVAVRNAEGKAQPLLFAPVLGGLSSSMRANETFSFSARLYVGPGDAYATYKLLAGKLFGFRDYRKNLSCSLNTTIENMISYAMNDAYAGWNADLKAPDYSIDVKNSVKTVSALHSLSIANVTDNEQIYRRRAVPTIEFLMSREKYLFTASEPVDTEQSPSHHLNGPAAEVSELAALQLVSYGSNWAFEYYARALWDKPRTLNIKMVSEGGSWQNALALYRLLGTPDYLEKAKQGANEYIAKRIERPQTDFSDARLGNGQGGQFWTDFAPKWIDLLELFESSRDRKYLDAAVEGARRYAAFVWVHPFSNERIVVNKGNTVGMHAYQNRLFEHPRPMTAPEQTIDAWQVSLTGLAPEASNTYPVNRAVFLAHHAPYMLRLYGYTGDTFFRDIARSAVIGRYANYPGYNIFAEYSNIYQRADYPLRPLSEATFNLFYYNHVWPQIAMLMDFLITDAAVRSCNEIDFPRRYAQGYAYLQCEVYGDRPGTFYGDKNVHLWLPAGLLGIDDVQANYVAAYGSDNLYLSFLNQSDAATTIRVRIDPLVVPYEMDKIYAADVWIDNKRASGVEMRNGELSVRVSGKGITAVRLKGIRVATQYQHKLHQQPQQSSPESFHERNTELGKVTGMIIAMGPSLKSVYVWLQATDLRQVLFSYKIGDGSWKQQTDKIYPFELSVPLSEEDTEVEYRVEAVRQDGTAVIAESARLKVR